MTNTYDFDDPIDRRQTRSAKWNIFDDDVIPLWVADMDFASPPAVLEALQQQVNDGIFGYTMPPENLEPLLVDRMQRLYGWDIQPTDLMYFPGVLSGISATMQAVVKQHAFVLQPPVYHPFHELPTWNNCHKQDALLRYVDQGSQFTYEIDFDALEAAITPETKMFLLCNPHNPIGRVWRRDELEKIAQVCEEHDLIICSDEIHCDLLFDNHKHIPIATLSAETTARTVTLSAPSKTFNLPGLRFSYAIVQNPDLHEQIYEATKGILMTKMGERKMSFMNMMGYSAAAAAYEHGDDWLQNVLAYMQTNRDDAVSFIVEKLPGMKPSILEGTYLLWLDCRNANLPDNAPGKFFLDNARVALNEGNGFGEGGAGFCRLNLACSHDLLMQALQQMQQALAERGATAV